MVTPGSAQPMLVQVGTDHTLATAALRERLALSGEMAAELLRVFAADPAIQEAAILATCNRTEIYAVSSTPELALQHVHQAFQLLFGGDAAQLDGLLVTREGTAAVRHLCAIAAGLQSMVIAEGQILGQVRDALSQAQQLGVAGPHIGAAFRAAIACGKRVRSETAIGRTDISASSVLIEMISREIDDWATQRVLIIGAGRMNRVTAERLRKLGAGSLVVMSRTLAAAQSLAQDVGGAAIPQSDLPDAVRKATLIVSATRSPGLMVTASMLDGREAGPLWVVDLAVPRDIDPAVALLPGVRLLDIDALRDPLSGQGLSGALTAAAAMVEDATLEWQTWIRTREAVPLIADLRAHVDRQKEAELARTLAQLEHLPEAERALVGEMAHRLVNKMFHHLAIRMKQAAAHPEHGAHYMEVARFLFERDEHARPTLPPAAELGGGPEEPVSRAPIDSGRAADRAG